MNQEVWKFQLEIAENNELELPKGYQVLDLQFGNKESNPCLWVLVYPKMETEKVLFELYGTGHSICNEYNAERKYIGTFQNFTGEFVGHLFQRIN
jgi:hypothetical protein